MEFSKQERQDREWVSIPSSGDLPNLQEQTQVSSIAGKFFTIWATREAPIPIADFIKSHHAQHCADFFFFNCADFYTISNTYNNPEG